MNLKRMGSGSGGTGGKGGKGGKGGTGGTGGIHYIPSNLFLSVHIYAMYQVIPIEHTRWH